MAVFIYVCSGDSRMPGRYSGTEREFVGGLYSRGFRRFYGLFDSRCYPLASHGHPLGSSQDFCRSLEPLRHSTPFGTDPTARDDVSGLPFAPTSALDSRASPHLPEDFDDSTARSNSATRASISSISTALGEAAACRAAHGEFDSHPGSEEHTSELQS